MVTRMPWQTSPQASGYGDTAASLTRSQLKGFVPNSNSPNEDILWHTSTLRQRGRMLYMGAPLATSAINLNRTKIVGTGLQLKPSIPYGRLGLTKEDAALWESKCEEEFLLWAEDKRHCDALGMHTFAELQQIALASWLMSGDVFALLPRESVSPLLPYGLRLHLVEADRIRTPGTPWGALGGRTDGVWEPTGNRIFDGVEVDAMGKVVAYHICNAYPNSLELLASTPEWQRVEAYGEMTGLPNILHLMHAERPEQYRGVTYLAQAMEPILQMRRFTDSTLMAALVQTFFSAWVVTDTDTAEMPFLDEEALSPESSYTMGAGSVAHLAKGEDIKFGNPSVPTASFDTFSTAVAKLCGAALEIPHEILQKEFNSSYSASRAALLEAWEAFKIKRSWLVDDFCQPVYEVWLTEAVARGRISAPGFFENPALKKAWSKARWMGPVQGHLDPVKEVNASILQVEHGFKTHEQITLELGGGDWNANAEKVRGEKLLLKQDNREENTHENH